jgi:hypothetical protein
MDPIDGSTSRSCERQDITFVDAWNRSDLFPARAQRLASFSPKDWLAGDVTNMLEALSNWLASTSLCVAFQTATWFVPAVQTVHILAVALVLTSIFRVSFHLLRVHDSSTELASIIVRSAPWVWWPLLALLLTGVLLTITEPTRELLNWAFRAKMILVLVLCVLFWTVRSRVEGFPTYWAASRAKRCLARTLGIADIFIGAAIVTAGRWIAYVQ